MVDSDLGEILDMVGFDLGEALVDSDQGEALLDFDLGEILHLVDSDLGEALLTLIKERD